MEKENNKIEEYFVPPNVSARFEIIDGFGIKELIICTIALLIGISLTFLSGLIATTDEISVEDLSFEQKLGLDEDVEVIVTKKPLIPIPIRVLVFIVVPTAMTFGIVRVNPINGLSILQMIKGKKEYTERQRRYLYIYNSGGKS